MTRKIVNGWIWDGLLKYQLHLFVLGYAGSLKATGNKLSSDKYEKFLKILEKTTAHKMTNARQV